MANVSKKENESMSIEYSDNNNTIIDNIEAIQKIDNDYYNNKSIEIVQTELNKNQENKFLENFRKIFDYYYIRTTYLLNLKKDIIFPNLDLNDFNSHINFFQEINRIFLHFNKNNNISEYYSNEALKQKIYDVVFINPKEKIDKFKFFKILDIFHHFEKYSANSIDRPKIINFSREILNFQNILVKFQNKFKELLSIKNYLIEYCKFKNNFDSRGDLLIPNTSNILKRGKENYNPPYGWIGIGLNVSGKYEENKDDEDGEWLFNYEDSKWANAYLGFYQEEDNNNKIKIKPYNIKEYLHDLVVNDENLEIFEKKIEFVDSRHWVKRYEKGIYLSPKIENVEKDAGIVTIGNKFYEVLLMAKVKINEISQPKDSDIWVLDKKFIRVYRILFKEIKIKIKYN